MAWKLEGCAIFLVIFMMLFAIQISNASTTYNVGDSNGWTFGVSNWPNGKNFKVGDVLGMKLLVYHYSLFLFKCISKHNFKGIYLVFNTLRLS